jgi:hypothetical protein
LADAIGPSLCDRIGLVGANQPGDQIGHRPGWRIDVQPHLETGDHG